MSDETKKGLILPYLDSFLQLGNKSRATSNDEGKKFH